MYHNDCVQYKSFTEQKAFFSKTVNLNSVKLLTAKYLKLGKYFQTNTVSRD